MNKEKLIGMEILDDDYRTVCVLDANKSIIERFIYDKDTIKSYDNDGNIKYSQLIRNNKKISKTYVSDNVYHTNITIYDDTDMRKPTYDHSTINIKGENVFDIRTINKYDNDGNIVYHKCTNDNMVATLIEAIKEYKYFTINLKEYVERKITKKCNYKFPGFYPDIEEYTSLFIKEYYNDGKLKCYRNPSNKRDGSFYWYGDNLELTKSYDGIHIEDVTVSLIDTSHKTPIYLLDYSSKLELEDLIVQRLYNINGFTLLFKYKVDGFDAKGFIEKEVRRYNINEVDEFSLLY